MTEPVAVPVAAAPAPDANTPISVPAPADATPVPDAQPAPASEVKPETPTAKAPEKYEFKEAEGAKFDSAVLGKFESLARELDMSQEQAQKFLDTMQPELAAAAQAQKAKAIEAWAEQTKADKEYGGDKLPQSLAEAKAVLDKFGTPELTKLLNDTGMGNHPEVVRAFVRIGQQMKQATFIPGGQGAAPKTNLAKTLYPDMN